MQFSINTLLFALAGTLSLVNASPAGVASGDLITPREAIPFPEPKANCCSCDLEDRGAGNYVCKVAKKSICAVPLIACPLDPATQEQCCCCDPKTPAMRCKAIPKGSGCICTAVKCPFQFDMSFLPAGAV
ncbi:uncharacterized protein CCOS01_16649 [Colletotrichum costaricense]|uniref:Uncharacterized protein n=1 Tax=Colletotrichum costaricense TaxID=1209916 RepID=A0AAJ0DSD6_9PEZI|nr:uncharacterized protein CCOS01_16649 [Colletotrichum costaricense]KAK1505959.1 hypothetical protein CCOS01_16649 [Colletotrichum costaricense]